MRRIVPGAPLHTVSMFTPLSKKAQEGAKKNWLRNQDRARRCVPILQKLVDAAHEQKFGERYLFGRGEEESYLLTSSGILCRITRHNCPACLGPYLPHRETTARLVGKDEYLRIALDFKLSPSAIERMLRKIKK